MKPTTTPTILVPIDFSPASAAGLRFALQWADQQKISLVCVHILHLLRPTSWSDKRYRSYANAEKRRYFEKLTAFVDKVGKKITGRKPDLSFVLIESLSPDIALEQYCRRRKDIDFVCIGTNGAGGLKRLFGTRTGNLIIHSDTPVIAVPASYRRRPLTRIIYASDLSDYAPELQQLIQFAGPLKAQIRALHLNYLGEIWIDETAFRQVVRQQFHYPLEINIAHADPNLSVTKNLLRQTAAFKPSMVALYTHHRHSAIQRLLYPSVAERLSFRLQVPLLVFPKTGGRTATRRLRHTSDAKSKKVTI